MKKIFKIGIVIIAILLWGITAAKVNQPQSSKLNSTQSISTNSSSIKSAEKVTPTCDGTTITTDCTVSDINYITYIYHPAVGEVTHTETVTTYQKEVSGYCTLCNDGTYSPSCATGRGACSHHGGVAQWNAPRYRTVPIYNNKVVVDKPAKEAYYEKAIR